MKRELIDLHSTIASALHHKAPSDLTDQDMVIAQRVAVLVSAGMSINGLKMYFWDKWGILAPSCEVHDIWWLTKKFFIN